MRKIATLAVAVLLVGCTQNSPDGGGPTTQKQEEPAAAHEPTACELIDRGEAETRAQCDLGKLGACRDIAGWVRSRVMEGCGASKIASTAAPTPEPAAAPEPTACELIDRGEAETRAQCDSGKLGACRDIAGWVRSRVMEGCGASKIASRAASEPASPASTAGSARPTPQASEQGGVLPAQQNEEIAEKAVVQTRSRALNPPRYPPAAFRAGIEGEVWLIVDVDAAGKVTGVGVETSSRNRDLDRAAVEAARRWSFDPAKSASGKPLPSSLRIPITFALSHDTTDELPED